MIHQLLLQCQENFGAAPRHFSLWNRIAYLRIPMPEWLRKNPDDELMTHFNELRSLYTNGGVVWGHLIQANRRLYSAGNENHPGELVYSLDDQRNVDPAVLGEVAHSLYQLKGTRPFERDLQPIAQYLTDEHIRVYGLAVPRSVSPFMRCRISTTMFVRKHLPNGRLCRPLLPVVVSREEPNVAMTLPERYWPPRLIQWWTQT
ncbi:MAG: hypothetical protein JNM43_18860 [Planctomycetaceae bacterium]|nr:hypothetical protein [Planctomycetaceae bacterium]